MWCASKTLCFAQNDYSVTADTTAFRLFATTTPSQPGARWTATLTPPHPDRNSISTVACPSPTICIAADGLGDVIPGWATASIPRLKAALAPKTVSLARLRQRRHATVSVYLPEPGRLVVRWTARLADHATPQTIATGRVTFEQPGGHSLRIALTSVGREWLARLHGATLTAHITFTPNGAAPVSTQHTLHLSR
ncbi:MAG: hypothetical protein WAL63_02640 [Solirubrobacteraceae bacterium]